MRDLRCLGLGQISAGEVNPKHPNCLLSTRLSLLYNRNMPRKIPALLAMSAALAASTLSGQNARFRPPTNSEHAMLQHYSEIIGSVLDQVPGDDWEEDASARFEITDQVAVPARANAPFDIDESIAREYHIRQGSKLFNEQMAPLLEKLRQSPTPETAQLVAKERPALHIHVNVHFNVPEQTPSKRSLQIAGASSAFQSEGDPPKETSVVLLFGDWQGALHDTGDSTLRFRFKHTGQSSAIENIVIELQGSADRITQILRSVDWSQVNSALQSTASS